MIKILSNPDFTKLEDFLHTFSYKQQAVMVLLMYCGLRVGELIKLRVQDLHLGDPKQQEVHINAWSTKTRIGRFVPIPTFAGSILQNYLHSQFTLTAHLPPIAYAFPGHAGRHFMSVHGIEQLVAAICYGLLDKHVTPHVFRHTYATKLLKHANIREVQMLLGHKKLSSTEIYTHPNMNDLAKTVKKTFS